MKQLKTTEILEVFVLCMAIVFVVLGTHAKSFGDTANSRLATVYGLTKHGTWFIDRPIDEDPNPFEQRTIDKVVVPGRGMLSSKPPMLPLFMTAEYVAFNTLFGWDLDDKDDTNACIRWMSLTLIGGAYMIALVLFGRSLRWYIADPVVRAMMLATLAFGTQLWGYSTNINNHVPGAGMMVLSAYLALGMCTGNLSPTPWRFFLFGLAGGLTFTLDMPATVFVALAGVALLVKYPKQTLAWTTAGVLIPLAVHFAIMVAITGSPLPVQMRKELYLSEMSYWRHPIQIDALNEPKTTYLFHMTFGRCGLFSLFPILLAGVVGTVMALRNRETFCRKAILLGALGFAILTAYYVRGTNNYGGEAYGFRWYIVAAPILLWMGAPLFAALRSRWRWIFVAVLVGVSFYSAWECTKWPWSARHEWTCRFLGKSY